jgi:hypothetical protein
MYARVVFTDKSFSQFLLLGPNTKFTTFQSEFRNCLFECAA